MLDNTLISHIRTALINGFTSLGKSGINVKRAYQPTTQGANSETTIYYTQMPSKRMGAPYKSDEWDSDLEQMVHTETCKYTTTFQFNAHVDNNETETANDILNYATYILQSDSGLKELRSNDIGVFAIQNTRNPYFKNDHEQFEASPSFDCTFTHNQIIISTTPKVDIFATEILRV